MKKVLISFITFIIIFNFICINPIYAKIIDSLDNSTGSYQVTFDQMNNDQTANIETEGGTQEVSIDNSSKSVTGTIVGYFSKIINMFPMIAHILITIVLNSAGIIENHDIETGLNIDNILYGGDIGLFSIQNIIFGKYLLLETDIFKSFSSVGAGDLDVKFSVFSGMEDTMNDFRNVVKLWFIIIRDVALVLNLAMLLYVAIRLAISTVASDKAKYKEFLYNWLFSIVIIFTIQYILVALNAFSGILIKIARDLLIQLEENGNSSFENEILVSMYSVINKNGGLRVALYSIVYWMLFWIELKFFFMYMKRMLKMVFLIVISPIITLTYPADKIGDGKAQAFTAWMKEYISNLLLQPLHCFLYLIFMFMANNIAIKAPLVGVIFLMSLTRGEKIIKSMLGVAGLQNVGDQFSMSGLRGKLQGMIPKPGPKPGMPRG